MNARDIIKLAAQLYVYDALKKKITILTNIQKGKDINVDIFLPKVTDVTVSDFAKHLQNEKMSELWSEEALIRQGAKINQELLEIQKTLDEIEKQGDM